MSLAAHHWGRPETALLLQLVPKGLDAPVVAKLLSVWEIIRQ